MMNYHVDYITSQTGIWWQIFQNLLGKSAIVVAGEFELMCTNTEVRKIIRFSKTNQDNPNL